MQILTIISGPHVTDWFIFLAVYVGIALGTIPFTRLDRASIALLGGVAVVGLHRLTFPAAISHIEFPTLALLFALMVLSAQLRVGGFYNRVIETIVASASHPWSLLISIILASAVLSAVFANDIICLVFTPVLCIGLRRAGRPALPYLIALATSSNIGSAATIIGNPQNMLIGQTAQLSFAHYTIVVAPLVAVCLVLDLLFVALIYRRSLFAPRAPLEKPTLHVPPTPGEPLPVLEAPAFDHWRVYKTLAVTALLVFIFVLGEKRTGMPREIAALIAAGVIMISRKTQPSTLLAYVDWNLILLFIGLFIVTGNVRDKGLMEQVFGSLGLQPAMFLSIPTLSGLAVVLSNIVSNVPAVLLIKPGIPLPTLAHDTTYTWYLLAVVTTFAGNLTLLGSIANLIVAEQSKPNGVEIGFVEYLKVGVPLTICNTVLAMVYFGYLM